MEHYNSIANQDIKRKFVSKEVMVNISSMMDYLIKKSYDDPDAPFSYEDIKNEMYYQDAAGNEYTESERDDRLDKLREDLEELDNLDEEKQGPDHDTQIEKIEEQIGDLESADTQYKEVYEWWMVSDYLGSKLDDLSEVVVDMGSYTIWGRRTSGQAILLDWVISKICEDMQILDGQPYAWNK